MLRDVAGAIIERGADSAIVADQVYFLFDDIRNSIVALPFFRAMRTQPGQEIGGNDVDQMVEIWTIRNTLWSLYFLNHSTRKRILKETSRNYVSKNDVCDMVFKTFKNEVRNVVILFFIHFIHFDFVIDHGPGRDHGSHQNRR